MLAYIHTCTHCGKQYTYYASGDGCNSPVNNEHLCPECMEAVLKALKNIPIQFEKAFVTKNDEFTKEQIFKFIQDGEEWNRQKSSEFPCIQKLLVSRHYKHVVEFIYENHLYQLFYNSSDDYELQTHVYISTETKLFDRFVIYNNGGNYEIKSYTNSAENYDVENTHTVPLSAPTGKFFFNDIVV